MRLARALHIFEADRRVLLLLGVTHLFVAAAHGLFDIGSTALLIAHLGPDTLPQVYLGSAFLVIFAGLFVIPIVDRLDRAKLFSAVLVIFAGLLLVSRHVAEEAPAFAYRGLYIGAYLMKSLVFLQFWLLAGDLLDIRQSRRLFPVLLGFSLVGGLAASITASLLPQWLATEALLTMAGGFLLAALVLVQSISRRWRGRFRASREKPQLSKVWKGLRKDTEISLSSPLLRTLSLCLLLLALLAQVLDFLMGKAAHGHFMTASGGVDLESLTAFYGVLNGIVIGAGAIVQFIFANRILSSLGVTRAQLLAPLAFLGAFVLTGGVWLAGAGRMAAGFFTAVLASRAVQKTLRISVVRTSTDLIYNAIPSERRGRSKALKETVIEPLGVLLGGLFLIAATTLPLSYVIGGGLVLSVVFLGLTIRLKDYYLESLVQVLKERSRFRFAFPSLIMRKPAARAEASPNVSGLRRALGDDEASVRLLAAEVASELKEPEAASLLADHIREETDAEVRSGMLNALGKMLRNHHERSDVDSLEDLDPWVRASGMESLAQSGIFRPETQEEGAATEEAETDSGAAVRNERPGAAPLVASATVARAQEGENAEPQVVAGDGAPDAKAEKRRFLLELARSRERIALERLVHYLDEGDGATRHLAARALESCGEAAIDILTLALWSTDVEARRYVIRALGQIGTSRAHLSLLPVLSLEAEEAYYDLVRLEALHHLPERPSISLLKDSLEKRVWRAKRNAHQVLRTVFLAKPGMRLILSNLNHPDPYVRSSAIEALEVRVDASLLGGILPLFEHENPRVIAEHGSSVYELPSKSPFEVLVELMRHRSPWIRACAVYVLGQVGRREHLRRLEESVHDGYELARLNAVEALGRLGDRDSLALVERLGKEGEGRVRDYALVAKAAIEERLGARSS